MTYIPRRTALAAALCATGVALLAGHAAHANDDVKFKGGGFGTLGAARTNLDDTQFRNGLTQYSGADKTVDLGVDSRLGLQGSVIYKSDFALTAQLLGMRRQDEDFNLDVEWLYAQYTGVPGLDLKAGRVALAAFLVSDSRYVGYATPWLRVPPLVYSMLPYSTVDGIQVGYRHSIGPAVASVQVSHGRSRAEISALGEFPPNSGSGLFAESRLDTRSPKVTNINLMLEWGDWTARIGQVKSDVEMTIDIPAPPFGGPLSGLPGPVFKDTFTGFGLQYDNGQVVAIAEHVKRKTKPQQSFDATAWYVGGGYHFGSVLPYVIISKFTGDSPGAESTTKGAAVGVRYDFASNLALKAEFARYDANNSLIFTDAVSPSVMGKKAKVISVALDFVF
ncbi:MAG: porin [Aquabacterium sp.]|uniref:porin n=1 Tax=Aquabacterium sp. TaxID=1872578 RepID=UPI002726F53F|nr:porin [Aquabacterium sp.]MDO9006119.1 porin [Aquabacterium sp.]